MANTEGFIVTLDGMTVQSAGELILDTEITSERRRVCNKSYIRCLEDFVFAVLFGDKFAVAGTLQRVGNESPGQEVISQFPELHVKLGLSSTKKPPEILIDPIYRERIKNDLLCLDSALSGKTRYWLDWIIREAHSSLGTHESLSNINAAPSDFVFAKEIPYVTDEELQAMISESGFLNKLAPSIREELSLHHATDLALKEFVSRNALTLMTIYWWYEAAITEAQLEDCVKLPHVVRASVREVELSRHQASKNTDKRMRFARTMIVRNALAEGTRSGG